MLYRIACTGAQGTGKSTLTRALADRLEADGIRVQAVIGIGEAAARHVTVTGSGADAVALRTFARLHVEREALPPSADVQIFDRCLLDTLAYATVLGCLDAAELRALGEVTVTSLRRFSQVLWLRVVSDYPVTSPRDETPEFRRTIDAAIGRLAREHELALVEYALDPERVADVVEDVVRRRDGL